MLRYYNINFRTAYIKQGLEQGISCFLVGHLLKIDQFIDLKFMHDIERTILNQPTLVLNEKNIGLQYKPVVKCDYVGYLQ